MHRDPRPAVALLAALLTLFGVGSAAAQPPPPPGTPAGTLSFARQLLSGGDSFQAATEFRRFLHHFPDHADAAAAREGLGRAFATAGRYGDAAGTFRLLWQEQPETPRYRWLYGAALYQGGAYPDAAAVLLDTAHGAPDDARAVLGTLAHLRGASPRPLPAAARHDLAEAYHDLPRKSPPLAGTLAAVLPGAGHLYCGRPRDATVSLLLNGVFLWGTYAAVQQQQWALAGILGFFELGWYSGNVVSATNAAHKWNRRAQGRFLRQWEGESLPQWNLTATAGGLGGTLSWRW